MADLSHLDHAGNIRMVDISTKQGTNRQAVAEGIIHMQPETLAKIEAGETPKGNVLTTAKIAGIQAAKKVPDIIPLCHQINLSWLDIDFESTKTGIKITATARAQYSTGVEMEALAAVSVTALTIYDMVKAIDKEMTIDNIRLVKKSGGKT
jgi:molybdenum cofactor biosynthesis protein MoaC